MREARQVKVAFTRSVSLTRELADAAAQLSISHTSHLLGKRPAVDPAGPMTRPRGSELTAERDHGGQWPARSHFAQAAIPHVRIFHHNHRVRGTYSWIRNWTGRLNLHHTLQELDTGDLNRIRERIHSPEDFLLDRVHGLPGCLVLRMFDTIMGCISI